MLTTDISTAATAALTEQQGCGAQCGERAGAIDQAWRHGQAALDELGLTAELRPIPAVAPGAWRCTLHRGDAPVPNGEGSGKGSPEVARVGALFEALEHHFSFDTGPAVKYGFNRHAHGLGTIPALAGEAAVALLAEGPNQPLACLPYRSLSDDTLSDDTVLAVPVFLSVPTYLDAEHATARAALGDTYDYGTVLRYSLNSGWAAGVTAAEAVVHAINEIIERDAMSLLLIDQFLAAHPPPLTVIDAATLPDELATLHHAAETRLGQPVSLIDMTTDLDVPAIWAYAQAPAGQPNRIRGCGASLSRRYAVERALAELIQLHAGHTAHTTPPTSSRVATTAYPRLHRCHHADFSTAMGTATSTPFSDTPIPTPATPDQHLHTLLHQLGHHGLTAYVWHPHHSDHLAVLNVIIPSLERFMVITDGQLVLPGPRGRQRLTTNNR